MTDRRETTFIGLVVTLLVVGVALSFGLAHHQQLFSVQATTQAEKSSSGAPVVPLVPIDAQRLTPADNHITQQQWSTTSSRTAIEDFYLTKLPQTGWQISQTIIASTPDSSLIVASKQDQKHYISIGSDQNTRQTIITISRVNERN